MSAVIRFATTAVVVVAFVWSSSVVRGQDPQYYWTTTNADAQRTSWVKIDPRISSERLQRGGLTLLWKRGAEHGPTAADNPITQPLLAQSLVTFKGQTALAYFADSLGNVYSVDYDLNRLFWKTRLDPVEMTSRRRSTCGGPLLTMATPRSGTGRVVNPNIYAVSGDGLAHVLNPQTGQRVSPSFTFTSRDSTVTGLVLVDNVLYATTNPCDLQSRAKATTAAGGSVWAVNLADRARTPLRWQSNGGAIAGSTGLAFGTDGTVYVALGDGRVVALDPKTLTLNDWFAEKTPFITSPLVCAYKGKDLIVAANSDGHIDLLDSRSLGGRDHNVPLSRAAWDASPAGSLATWESADGVRWVLASTPRAIVAFKVVDHSGLPTLELEWTSRSMTAPLSPFVLNDVILVVSSGEYLTSDRQLSLAERKRRSTPAVLYALDARTGRELWNTGGAIASYAHGAGPAGGDGLVYVSTHEGTLYVFGIPLEH